MATERWRVRAAREFDTSILEYKDVFRLWPVMPLPSNLDPGTMQKTFERENACYKGLDWELEDLLPQEFMDAFLSDYPGAVARTTSIEGKVHRDLTRDGKARLHRFVKQHAARQSEGESRANRGARGGTTCHGGDRRPRLREIVTEIFIRVNSAGTRLREAELALARLR